MTTVFIPLGLISEVTVLHKSTPTSFSPFQSPYHRSSSTLLILNFLQNMVEDLFQMLTYRFDGDTIYFLSDVLGLLVYTSLFTPAIFGFVGRSLGGDTAKTTRT